MISWHSYFFGGDFSEHRFSDHTDNKYTQEIERERQRDEK